MGGDQPVQDFPARCKGIKGSDLIGSHEAAIALNISREDGGQPALRFNGLGQSKPQCNAVSVSVFDTLWPTGSIAAE